MVYGREYMVYGREYLVYGREYMVYGIWVVVKIMVPLWEPILKRM